MKTVATNINNRVIVKLTEDGLEELHRQHEVMRNKVFKDYGYDMGMFIDPRRGDGLWVTQMWDLMHKLGHKTSNQGKQMFETDIYIIGAEVVESPLKVDR